MTEPPSAGQIQTGTPIPHQSLQAPAGWSAVPAAAPPKRSRAGLIAVLVLVGVLALCGGIAGTAAYVSNTEYGIGADSPLAAANGYLTGVYLHQEASEADAFLCQRADPNTLVKHKIREARTETDRYNASYSWSPLQPSDETDSTATISTLLTSTGSGHSVTTRLTLTMIEYNGWWVCDVKASKN